MTISQSARKGIKYWEQEDYTRRKTKDRETEGDSRRHPIREFTSLIQSSNLEEVRKEERRGKEEMEQGRRSKIINAIHRYTRSKVSKSKVYT